MAKYNLKTLFDKMNNSGPSKMGVGIFPKVTWDGAEIGENFIDFNYSKDGLTQNKRTWFPGDSSLIKLRKEETLEEGIHRDFEERIDHVALHVNAICGTGVMESIDFDDFEGLAKKVMKPLNARKGTFINLKTIPDSNLKYSAFPYYASASCPYIEKYVEGKEPTLYYDNWETEQRMVPFAKAKEGNAVSDNDTSGQPGASADLDAILGF